MEENVIELKLTPVRELFYGNDFGVYACETEDDHLVELNTWGNFVVNGQMPKLVTDKEYSVTLKEVQNKKYGKGYEVVSIKHELPQTIEQQHAFLRSILTESQADLLINALPNADIIAQIKNNTLDYKSIKGIGNHTYNKIKEKIIENIEIQEALTELSQYGITYKMIKKLIAHYDMSPELVVQIVKNNPYSLCAVSGLGFLKVDEYALKMGIEENSPNRINAAIDYILKQEENNGHCWIKVKSMLKQLVELTKLSEVVLDKHLQDINDKEFYVDGLRIGSTNLYRYENRIKDYLQRLIRADNKFNVSNIEERIVDVEETQGFTFTDEQRKAIYTSVESNVVIISGKAGTGKSTILKGILSVLSDYSYETCAFSGKASQRIVESTGLTSKTIHRLLDYKPHVGFQYNDENKLPYDIIVLDEASMVNVSLFYNLISAIEEGSKLIILGDREQLPAIGAGALFGDMIDSGVVNVVELTQVHRQALKSGILLAANYVREGKQITGTHEDQAKVVGELKDLHIVPKDNGEEIADYIKNVCEKSKDKLDIMDFQVIVPMKSRGTLATKNLNIMLQDIFNPDDTEGLKRNGYTYKVGDKIIKSGNDYEHGVFNGTLGMIKVIDMEENSVGIEFVGHDNLVWYNQDDMDQIDMAYALTVHRTQGSQFKHVIFGLDYAAYVLLNRQLTYTGLTRASEKCVLVCENRALRHAISKSDSNKRNTFLKELLLEEKYKSVI